MTVLVHVAAPAYPQEARDKGIEGEVGVRIRVDKEGKVNDGFVSKRVDPSLDRAALSAAFGASFKPARLKGKPVEVWVYIPVRFSLK